MNRLTTLLESIGYEPEAFGKKRLQKGLEKYLETKDYAFLENLLITHTWFFRHPDTFDYLKKELVKVKRKEPFKVLSVGCSTGEEPYSIAILLEEIGMKYHIDALDLSKKALAIAQEGLYFSSSFKEKIEIQERYFTSIEHITTKDIGYKISEKIRKNISFFQMDILKQSLKSSDYDLIFCRNLLIYFTKQAQNYVVSTLNQHLCKEGKIVTSPAESSIFLREGFCKTGPFYLFHKKV